MKNEYKKLSFYFSNGNIEILEFLNNNSPIQFKDIRNLTNPKTRKKFSSRTVSIRLKELEENGDIENRIIKNKNKRKIIGYSITEKGMKSLNIIKETQSKFEKLNRE